MTIVHTDAEGSVGGASTPEAPGLGSEAAEGKWSRLRTHVVLLVMLLVAVASMTDLTSSWTSDDGSYAVSARLVRDHGTWMYPADPVWAEGLTEPAMVNGTVTDEGLYPYVRQPLWVTLLAASSSVVPEPVGLYLWQISAVLLAAVMAWVVAVRVRPEAAPLAFWTIAAAPAIVWAFGLWAHAPMVLMGGVASWGLVRVSAGKDQVDLRGVLALASASGVAVLLRSEGLVVVVAAASGSAWSILAGPEARKSVRATVTVTAILVAGVGARACSSAWAASIATGSALPPSASPEGSWVGGRFSGALATIATTALAPTGAFLLGVVAIVLAVAVGARLAETGRIDRTQVALALGWIVVTGVRGVVYPQDHLSGLLAAAPLITAGLVGYRWSSSNHRERSLVVYCVVFVGVVLATQYDVGGGHEWGGRFLSGALVPLAVVASSTLLGHVARGGSSNDLRRTVKGSSRRDATLVVLALLVVPAVLATVVTWHGRSRSDGWIREVERAGAPVVVTVERIGAHIGWRTIPEVRWVRTEPENLVDLLERAVDAGEGDLVVLGASVEDVADIDCAVEPLRPRILHVRC